MSQRPGAGWRQIGLDERQLIVGKSVGLMQSWVAVSTLVDPKTVEQLRQRFTTLQSEGKIAEITNAMK